MSQLDEIQEHAAAHPLTERLRGQHWMPGVHYAAQADVWMREAADEIDRLGALIADGPNPQVSSTDREKTQT